MDYFIQRLTIKSESPFNPGDVIPGIYCFQLILSGIRIITIILVRDKFYFAGITFQTDFTSHQYRFKQALPFIDRYIKLRPQYFHCFISRLHNKFPPCFFRYFKIGLTIQVNFTFIFGKHSRID